MADEGLGQVDEFRARGKELGDWPDWCFPSPHVRKAHWHSLWVGKRDQADARSVTWEPPPHRTHEGQKEPPLWAGQSGGSARMVLRVGHSVVVYDRPHCSIGREFTVISPELLPSAGWGWLRRAGPTGIPGDPGRSVGTASNLEDALAIHRGEPEQSCGGPPLKPFQLRQSRSS